MGRSAFFTGYKNKIARTILYIYIKKKAFKINAKIEDVGLNEDLKSTETRNGH